MPFQHKHLVGPLALTTSSTLVYTVPASKTSIVKQVVVANTTGSSATFTLRIGASTALFNAVTVAANDSLLINLSQVLETTETLYASASANTTLNLTISGVENDGPLEPTETYIADNAITTPKLSNASVTTDKLAADAVTTAKIANNAITQAKLSTDVPLSGMRNVLINGGFDVWQRTTSSEYSASLSTAEWKAPDRWWTAQLATASTLIVERKPADTTNFNYGCRVQRKSLQTGTGTIYFGQTLESVTSKACAGKQVTLSFYVKKGANAPSTFDAVVYGGKGTDQTSGALFSTGFTSGANLLSQTVTPTTTMTRYIYTFAVDSTYTQLALWFKWTPSGTAGADEWFQFEGVQLEQGTQPTPFEQRPIGVELALCQRYYQMIVSGNSKSIAHAYMASTTAWESIINLPVPMRSAATIDLATTVGGAQYFGVYVNNFEHSINAIPNSDFASADRFRVYGVIVGSTSTAGASGMFYTRNAAARLAVSAEL